jgi:hypothetical protein
MERRWLRLAHSYQFAKKLKSFRKPALIATSCNKPREESCVR